MGLDAAQSRAAASLLPGLARRGRGLRFTGSGGGRLRKRRASKRVAEAHMRAARGDDVEQIAMIAGRRIGPFSGARLALAAAEADVETSPRCIMHIADQPIMAFAATVREIVAAPRLGTLTETARTITGGAFPAGLLQAALRSETRSIGNRSP